MHSFFEGREEMIPLLQPWMAILKVVWKICYIIQEKVMNAASLNFWGSIVLGKYLVEMLLVINNDSFHTTFSSQLCQVHKDDVWGSFLYVVWNYPVS
jgi:hypothetical protein